MSNIDNLGATVDISILTADCVSLVEWSNYSSGQTTLVDSVSGQCNSVEVVNLLYSWTV